MPKKWTFALGVAAPCLCFSQELLGEEFFSAKACISLEDVCSFANDIFGSCNSVEFMYSTVLRKLLSVSFAINPGSSELN
jgi:hypothetical protein